MKILLIGAGGTIGSAVHTTLTGRGHEVVTVGRTSGDVRLDMSDPQAVGRLYEQCGQVDAVAVAAGDAVFGPLDALTYDDFSATLRGKALSQVELVRQGTRHVAPRGSFTLVTGVLTHEPVPGAAAAAAANGAVEAFVRAAAIELAPQRVNAVSPGLVAESADAYGQVFPGVEPVPAARVATAYVRAIEGAATGQVLRVGH
ncbi:short chain dehydrogenase [Streptomyces cinnamoneus]|uniref:Short chain dehydrogenase n=1 Tax=Streptomyces cinnamoneus TaxID=53446 RepID=A0A2G1XJR0_STRCJ|nr:short chain dehydrogenase [Streptomyces cinnamoneus]PHQ51488.1 short chain dehydrogenase [Streptomyces cinnamoneus]PPT11670.1 short chain dehydrogenase [Streptomyces cinnamoneus]